MAEFLEAGYQDIRDHVENTWTYVEVRDDEDSVVLRIGAEDERVEWTHDPESQELRLELLLSGSDEEITVGTTTVNKSVIYKTDDGGEPLAEEYYSPFVFDQEEDELLIVHRLQIPKKEQ